LNLGRKTRSIQRNPLCPAAQTYPLLPLMLPLITIDLPGISPDAIAA
jgi:hypothetical protein